MGFGSNAVLSNPDRTISFIIVYTVIFSQVKSQQTLSEDVDIS